MMGILDGLLDWMSKGMLAQKDSEIASLEARLKHATEKYNCANLQLSRGSSAQGGLVDELKARLARYEHFEISKERRYGAWDWPEFTETVLPRMTIDELWEKYKLLELKYVVISSKLDEETNTRIETDVERMVKMMNIGKPDKGDRHCHDQGITVVDPWQR